MAIADTGILVMGYTKARGNDTYFKKDLFIREYCSIYQEAKKLKKHILMLTDPISCIDLNNKNFTVGECPKDGCDYANSNLLKGFIKKNNIKKLKVYLLSHGVQNTSFGRPPEKNTIDLGEVYQNTDTLQLFEYFKNAIENKLDKIEFHIASCYGGGFHELPIRLMESNKVSRACSVSQSPHSRVAIVSLDEIHSTTPLLFTQSFIESISKPILTSLEEITHRDAKLKFPSKPGMLAWSTSSMYYIDKKSKTGVFHDEKTDLIIPNHLYIIYPDYYPINAPSYFPMGLRVMTVSRHKININISKTALSVSEKNFLDSITECEEKFQ